MIGAVIAKTLLWTLIWAALTFLVLGVTLLGDCPEYIHANWPDHICSNRKDVARYVIFIGAPLIWLAVAALIFRRRRR